MPVKPSAYHLDADDYVHVVQTTGAAIEGFFDGMLYRFEDGIPSDPVHWKVAHHIFGFRGTEQARLNALHRLGWLHRMALEVAMDMLRKCVRYEPLELLPKGVLEFRRPDSNVDDATVMPTAGHSSNVGTEASSGTSAPAATPPDPSRKAHPDPLRKAKQG